MIYTIKFRPSVEKSLKKLPKKELIRIKRKIDALAENLPDPATTKIKGNNKFHKIRAGDYRIIYEIYEDTLVILVAKIGHRKDIYKRLSCPLTPVFPRLRLFRPPVSRLPSPFYYLCDLAPLREASFLVNSGHCEEQSDVAILWLINKPDPHLFFSARQTRMTSSTAPPAPSSN